MVKPASQVWVGFKLGAATDRPAQPFFLLPTGLQHPVVPLWWSGGHPRPNSPGWSTIGGGRNIFPWSSRQEQRSRLDIQADKIFVWEQYNGAARPVFCVGGPPLTPWVLRKAPKRVERSKIRLLEAFYSPQG